MLSPISALWHRLGFRTFRSTRSDAGHQFRDVNIPQRYGDCIRVSMFLRLEHYPGWGFCVDGEAYYPLVSMVYLRMMF